MPQGADGNPDYDVELPDQSAGDGVTGDDTSRGADTSRATTTGAPNGGRPTTQAQGQGNGQRPGSVSSAGSPTGAGAQVPSGLLREAKRQIRRLEAQLASAMQGGGRRQQDQPPPRRDPNADLDPETRQIKEQLFKVVPWLARLEQIDPEAIERLLTDVPATQQRSEGLEQLYWRRNANAQLREIDQHVRQTYGEDVSPKAIRRFQAGFLDWVESDPDARERYIDGDPSLVQEYWAETSGLIVEPIRSKANSEAVTRAERVNRLPRITGRGGPLGQPRRQEKKARTDDEVHEEAWNALVERASSVR